MVKAAGPGLTSARAWRTICDLLSRMALHPEAAPIAMDALQLAAAAEQLSVASFIPVLECASQIAERNCTVSLWLALLAARLLGHLLPCVHWGALQLAVGATQLSAASFLPVLECSSQIAERNCTDGPEHSNLFLIEPHSCSGLLGHPVHR